MRTAKPCLLLLILSAPALFGQLPNYADIVEDIRPAVVNIRTQQVVESNRGNDPFSQFFNRRSQRPQESNGAGSGFIISPDGYIVTNRHVVKGASTIKVFLDNEQELEADLIGIDDSLDIALIKVDARGLTHLKLANSDRLRIGEPILALGYPLQLGFTVTSGIISGIGRNMNADGLDLATYLQIDADITFGNSGGPLVNPRGEVVGINTMILSNGETFGFAIPSNLFRNSIDQLRRNGMVRRGALGVSLTSLNNEAREYHKTTSGAMIGAVHRDLPAAKAGLRAGDVILEVDGQKVKNQNDLIASIARRAPGDSVKLLVSNDSGKRISKTVTLTDRTELDPRNVRQNRREEPPVTEVNGLGFSVLPMNNNIRKLMELPDDAEGVVVGEVAQNSMAANRGLVTGQVITSINNRKVTSPQEVREVLQKVPGKAVVPIDVVTRTESLFSSSLSKRRLYLRNTP